MVNVDLGGASGLVDCLVVDGGDFGIGDGASVLVVGGGCFCLLTVLVIVIYPRVIKSFTYQ